MIPELTCEEMERAWPVFRKFVHAFEEGRPVSFLVGCPESVFVDTETVQRSKYSASKESQDRICLAAKEGSNSMA